MTYTKAVNDATSYASNIIAWFEGFSPKAYWDVNAFRIGYGSDTEGPEEIKVVKGMTTTRERALGNLAMRVPDFLATAEKQIGADLFVKLGLATRAALGSLAYNYGELPSNVVVALTSNSKYVSTAIAIRANDNEGVNSRRRNAEAALVALDGGQT